jgi:hypothetical protein
VVSFTYLPLYVRGKGQWYTLDRRLGGPQSRSERHGEVKILNCTGTRTPTPLVVQLVAIRYADYATAAPTDITTIAKEITLRSFVLHYIGGKAQTVSLPIKENPLFASAIWRMYDKLEYISMIQYNINFNQR